jgi:hypothetical protein
MSRLSPALLVMLVFAGIALGTSPSHAQETLTAARELYAAASYDEALNKLDELSAKHEAIKDPGAVALYRALCLYGLGRSAEGDRAVEALVAGYPMYRPPLDDLSPRIRTTVIETRRRILPALLQQQYAAAKGAYDRQEYTAAIGGFAEVLTGLDDPDIAAAVSPASLADLRTLSTGFRDLAQKALAPPPAAAPPPLAVAAAPVVALPPRVYTPEDAGVIAPVPVRQVIPPYTRTVVQKKTAIVQLVVNETGAVESAAMLTPLDPAYDRTVVNAARTWQYMPARVDGKPVKYLKRVQIALVPSPK